jgi:hypothetical protein
MMVIWCFIARNAAAPPCTRSSPAKDIHERGPEYRRFGHSTGYELSWREKSWAEPELLTTQATKRKPSDGGSV